MDLGKAMKRGDSNGVGTGLCFIRPAAHVALLQGTDARHHDEFDLALNQLGWTVDRYINQHE